MNIIILAPYSSLSNSGSLVNLAASRKIELIVKILSVFSNNIILINSAHNSNRYRKTVVKRSIINGVKIIEVTPFTVKNRKIGKLLNLLFCFFTSLRYRFKNKTTYLWLYNGYSFECLFSLLFSTKRKIIIEIEDLPFSRKRGGFEIKDRLDDFFLKKTIKKADLLTFVNEKVREDLNSFNETKNIILPSLISKKLLSNTHFKKPFSDKNRKVGYFGGLSEEKGVLTLIELSKNMPTGWELIITGVGEYSKTLEALSNDLTSLSFFGSVNEDKLYYLMGSCDILINPHTPINEMNNGIFPFKICEYLVTERLVISTQLPKIVPVINDSIIYYDNTLNELLSIVKLSDKIYSKYKDKILLSSLYIRNNYTEGALIKALHTELFYENP